MFVKLLLILGLFTPTANASPSSDALLSVLRSRLPAGAEVQLTRFKVRRPVPVNARFEILNKGIPAGPVSFAAEWIEDGRL